MARPTKPQNTEDKRITPAFRAQAGKGRPKGTQNKLTGQVKEMILAALDKAGGVDYLAMQADENPAAFMSLVGKVLPLTLQGDPAAPLIVEQKLREDVDVVTSTIAGLAERARAARVDGRAVH